MHNDTRPTVQGKCENLGHIQTRRDERIKLGTCNFCHNRETEQVTEVTGGALAFRACDECLVTIAKSADDIRRQQKIEARRSKAKQDMDDYLANGGQLYNADPNCDHIMDLNNWSGVKCAKCGGWFCY